MFGVPPIQVLIYQMAELLLKEYVQNALIEKTILSDCWVYCFIT